MKKTNKKGFTLVELLVVIAILAILATVSVVGYTAFIERATVSNDENVAAQLNQFLTAMKADSTGNFYNKELVVKNGDTIDIDKTVRNIRQAVKFAITDSGLNAEGKLAPDSAKYNYHFYYDTQENKIVVLSDNDAMGGQAPLMKMLAKAEGEIGKSNPATCFTVGGRYVFLDNDGSELAEIVEKLFKLEGDAMFSEIKEKLGSNSELKEFIDNNIIVDQSGKEHYDGTGKSEGYFVTEPSTDDGIISIVGTHKDKYPDEITMPEYTEATGDFGDSTTVTLVGTSNASDIAGRIEPEFIAGTIKNEQGATYTKSDSTVTAIGDHTDTATVNQKWDTVSFVIKFTKDENKVREKTDENDTYYAKYGETIGLYAEQTQRNKKDSSKTRTINSLSGIEFDDNQYVNVADGNLTWKSIPADSDPAVKINAHLNDEVSVKSEITILVDFCKSADLKVGANEVVGNSATVVFNSAKADNDTNDDLTKDGRFTMSINHIRNEADQEISPSYTYNIFDFEDKLEVTIGDNTEPTVGGSSCTVAPNATTNKTLTLTVKVNGAYTKTVNVDLYDIGNLPVQLKDLGSHIGLSSRGYLGNDENTAITAAELFDLTKLPTGATLVAYNSSYGDDKYNDIRNRSQLSPNGGVRFSYDEGTGKLTFDGTSSDAITLAWVKDGVRISPDVTFNVVNAKNLKPGDDGSLITKDPGANEATTNQNTTVTYPDGTTATVTGSSTKVGSNHHQITAYSLVLLGDYDMPSGGYIALAPNCTIYGNMYTLNCKPARTNTAYVIGLYGNAAIQDIKIIGNDYSEDKDPWDDDRDSDTKSGTASMVSTFGGGSITNAYIAYGRSPIRTRGAATIKDTVLFGGVYSNLDIQNGVYTVSLKNVTTINQGNVGTQRIGGGVVVATWKDTGAEHAHQDTTIKISGSFTQYNFVGDNETDKLMKITSVAKNLAWSQMFPGKCGSTEIPHGGGIYSGITANFTFKYRTGETIRHWGYEENEYRFYMNPGIIYLKVDNGLDDNGDINIKIYYNDVQNSAPDGYGAASYAGMTAISTLNTFNNMNDDREEIESYRNKAKAYMPSQCTANISSWTFTYTAPAN